MTSLTDYICINHHLMTIPEMAAEADVPDAKIRYIMERKGWKVFSPVDRIREYIQAHPGAIVEDIAEKFDTGVNYIRELARKEQVELTTRFQATGKKEQPVKKQETNYSLMHRAFNGADPEDVKEAMEIISGEPKEKTMHIREAYSQGGSPYGIADEVRNLKLNK